MFSAKSWVAGVSKLTTPAQVPRIRSVISYTRPPIDPAKPSLLLTRRRFGAAPRRPVGLVQTGAEARPAEQNVVPQEEGPVGEDAASFDFESQSLKSWAAFVGVFAGVMGLLYVVCTRAQKALGIGTD